MNTNKKHPWFLLSLLCAALLFLLPSTSYADNTYTFDSSGSSHFFDPSANDQSLVYLGEIFGTMEPVLAGAGSTFLGRLFNIFNTVVLTIAIFFVGYTTFVGILNTAGEGEMFGRKWSSLWVPVRLVLGIGLLVPTTSGYCVAQMTMMWIVVQGIGAADHLTNTVIDYMESGQTVFIRSMQDATGGDQGASGGATGGGNGTGTISAYDTTIQVLYQNMTCMQSIYKNSTQSGSTLAPIEPPKLVKNSDGTQYTMTFPDPTAPGTTAAPSEACGKITIDKGTAGISGFNTFYDPYMISAVNAIMPSINAAAYYMVNYNPNLYDNDPTNDTVPFDLSKSNSEIEKSVLQATYNFVGSNYLNELSQTYQSFVDQAERAVVNDDSNHTDYYENIRAYGWVSLGNIYWYMIKSVSSQLEAEGASLCMTSNGSITDASGVTHLCKPPGTFNNKNIDTYTGTYAPDFIASLINTRDEATDANSSDFVVKSAGSFSPIGAMVKAITGSVMTGLSDRNKNPMVSAQKIGHKMIMVVQIFFAVFTAVTLAYGLALGWYTSIQPGFLIAQMLTAMLLPSFFVFATIFLILGGTLSIIIPTIPAIIFLLAVIHWMVSVTEAMVAGPIVGMGILHPEGSELWGKAEPAVMLMVNMFLRPSLIVLGLAAGVMLSFVSTGFINFAFFNAMNLTMSSNDSNGGSTTAIESVMFLFIYVGLIIAAINKSFGTIHAIPDMLLRWISGGERASFGRGGAEDMQKVSEQQGKGESAGKEQAQDSSKSAQSAQDRGQKGGRQAKKDQDSNAARPTSSSPGTASDA